VGAAISAISRRSSREAQRSAERRISIFSISPARDSVEPAPTTYLIEDLHAAALN
jgi:hypothetical protein